MIEDISKRLVTNMLNNSIIIREEYKIYRYGCELFISTMINTIFILFQSLFVGRVLETLFFISFFCSIRIYAGGIHASSHFKCIFFTNIIYLLDFLILYPFLENCINYLLKINFILFTIIILIVPIIDCDVTWKRNEDIDEYGKKARVMCCLVFAIMIIVHKINSVFESEILISGNIAFANNIVLLMLAFIKRKVSRNY